jgi:glutathione peroxidase
MIKILMTVCLLAISNVSIYSASFTASSGGSATFQQFSGKKMLIVNVASASPDTAQLAALQQQLATQHSSNLVIVALPSNSFGNEPLSGTALHQYYKLTRGFTFHVSSLSAVKGDSVAQLYSWLTIKEQNEVMNSVVQGDYRKYVISETGKLVGYFASEVSPLDSLVQNAITTNY